MAEAKRDGNYITTLLAVSSADGVTPVVLYADPTTHRLLVSISGGVTGPGSSTDNAIVRWDGTGGGTLQDSGILVSDTNVLSPAASDAGALGSTTLMWSDLFLASGAVVNFDNGNVVLTHSSGVLTVGTGDLRVTTAGTNAASVVTVGGTQTLTNKTLTSPVLNAATVGTSLVPTSDDGAALGSTSNNFSDLFLATGAVINYANGNVVLTHSSGILTVSTGDLRVTTAGTNAASVVTVGGTQTLTNKTLTSPVIAIIVNNGNNLTLPTTTDTIVGRATTDTLTNKTLTSPTITTANLSGSQQLEENASIKLDTAGSADGKYSGITITGTAGTTVAFGDLVYLAAADSRWELADADAASTSGDVPLAIVLSAGNDGDAVLLLLVGNVRADAAFPALTIGAPAYVSTTAGDIQVAQPSGTDDVIRRVGFALTADELFFNPSNDYVTHT